MNHDNDWLERTGVIEKRSENIDDNEYPDGSDQQTPTRTRLHHQTNRYVSDVYIDPITNTRRFRYTRPNYDPHYREIRSIFNPDTREITQEIVPPFNDREEFERITTEIIHRLERLYLENHDIEQIKDYLTYVTDNGMIDRYMIELDYISDHYRIILTKGELNIDFRLYGRW